jgi:methylmalonyl-CoA mutase N-terminal domain/subunit
MGGAVAAIQNGFMPAEVENSSYKMQQEIENGTRRIVGVNEFVGEIPPMQPMELDPNIEALRIEALKQLRAERSNAEVEKALGRVRDAAEGDDNLMEPIIAAVKAMATNGEICGALREVFGEHRPFTSY